MSFFSSSDLRNIVMSFKYEDVQTVYDELDRRLYLWDTFYYFDWMVLGETAVRKTDELDKRDFAVVRQQEHIVVTSDGDLFKIKIHIGVEYGVTNYDEFKTIINHYKEEHGSKPIVDCDLAEELKCRAYVKTVELEEIEYYRINHRIKKILKNAYEKGVISLDTLLDKVGMLD